MSVKVEVKENNTPTWKKGELVYVDESKTVVVLVTEDYSPDVFYGVSISDPRHGLGTYSASWIKRPCTLFTGTITLTQ